MASGTVRLHGCTRKQVPGSVLFGAPQCCLHQLGTRKTSTRSRSTNRPGASTILARGVLHACRRLWSPLASVQPPRLQRCSASLLFLFLFFVMFKPIARALLKAHRVFGIGTPPRPHGQDQPQGSIVDGGVFGGVCEPRASSPPSPCTAIEKYELPPPQSRNKTKVEHNFNAPSECDQPERQTRWWGRLERWPGWR